MIYCHSSCRSTGLERYPQMLWERHSQQQFQIQILTEGDTGERMEESEPEEKHEAPFAKL